MGLLGDPPLAFVLTLCCYLMPFALVARGFNFSSFIQIHNGCLIHGSGVLGLGLEQRGLCLADFSQESRTLQLSTEFPAVSWRVVARLASDRASLFWALDPSISITRIIFLTAV